MKQPTEAAVFTVQVIAEVAGFGILEDALKELDRRHPPETVYQSSQFLVPWLTHVSRRSSPRLVILREDREPRAVLPLVADEIRRGPLRIARLGLPTQGGHPPALDVRAGEEEAAAVADVLLAAFVERSAGWHVLSLQHLSGNSPLLRLLPELCRERGLDFCWRPARRESYLVLDGDWETYLARLGRNHRKAVNRVFRRLEEVPGWEFVEQWPTIAEVPAALARYLAAVRDSWKAAEADDAEYVRFLESVMQSFASTGDLLMSWLQGPPGDGAALIQLRRGGAVAAFHQAYTSLCPVKGAGTELLAYAIRRGFERGTLIYDFSTAADHIHRWNPLYRNTFHVYVTKRTPVGRMIRHQLAHRPRRHAAAGEPVA